MVNIITWALQPYLLWDDLFTNGLQLTAKTQGHFIQLVIQSEIMQPGWGLPQMFQTFYKI